MKYEKLASLIIQAYEMGKQDGTRQQLKQLLNEIEV